MTKSKRTLPSDVGGGDLDSSSLAQALLERFPVPLDELPPSIRETVDMALHQAADGDPRMISALLESMDQVEESIDSDSEFESPAFALSSDAAADVLSQLDARDDVERFVAVALEAIAIDPAAVDAFVVLGDVAASREERVSRYRQASEAAARHDPDTVAAVMPFIRQHMSQHLINDGNVLDAGEILRPAFDEDPRDLAGARYPMIEVCLRLGWLEELDEIAERFSDDDVGPVDFARALLAFARTGNSRRANALLRAAVEKHPGVAEYLSGAKRMPMEGERLSASEHDAVAAAEYLLPGLREIEGVVGWIRETAGISPVDCEHGSEDAFESGGEELRELAGGDPLGVAIELPTEETTWQLVIERRKESSGYVVILLGDEELVAANHFEQRPSTNDLRAFAISAVVDPMVGTPRKPQTIRVPTKADMKALQKSCGTYGVTVSQGKLAKEDRRLLEPALEMISRQLGKPPAGEIDLSDETIEMLPLINETWLYGVFQPPLWIHDGPSPRRTYVQLVVDSEQGFLLHHGITESVPSIEAMATSLRTAMVSPAVGEPRRVPQVLIDPTSIGFADDDCDAAQLSDQLPSTACSLGDDQLSSYFSEIVGDMLSHNGPTDQALRDVDGLDATMLGEFYEILANFYRAKPWKMVGGDQLFDVTCPSWSIRTRTACVIGQLGQERGIAVYDDPETARQMIAERDDCSMSCAAVVHYGEEFDAIPVDAWHRERNHWSVAGKEVHPFVARVVNLRTIRSLTAEDVQVLMAILPVVPRFLDHPRDAPLEVDSANGQLTFRWCTTAQG